MKNLTALESRPQLVKNILLWCEWIWIVAMILAFWHRSPPFRDQYVFLLGFALPIYGMRWIVHRRLFTYTPLDITFLVFIVLSVYNFNYAPISRAEYWVLLCRPFLGILIIHSFVETVRQQGTMRYLILVTVLLGIIIGSLALIASQWAASDKSDEFSFIINLLPALDYRQVLPDMQLSFNPNEIAGALAYFCPFLLATALGTFIISSPDRSTRWDSIIYFLTRWGSVVGFLLVTSAMMLGQSRFALFGAFIGSLIVLLMVLPNWKLRAIGLFVWSAFVILEILLVMNVFPIDFSAPAEDSTQTTITETATPLNERDERTLLARFDLWERALRMVRDYPTTGAGMSTYRALVMRDEYMIPLYEGRQFGPPHAHNAFFQLGADFGVMGLILFLGWYGLAGWMAFQTYKQQNLNSVIMTIAITSGILSYMGYGIGDTITLWDRFAFIHWWFIGLIASLYIHQRGTITLNSPSN